MQVIHAGMSLSQINAIMSARLNTAEPKKETQSSVAQRTEDRMALSYGDEHLNTNVFEGLFFTEDPVVIPVSSPETKENILVPKQETETEVRSASPKPPEVIVDPQLEAAIAADAANADIDIDQPGMTAMEAALFNAGKNAKRNASRNRRK